MRWSAHKKPLKNGDTKRVLRFALWPVKIVDVQEEMLWLEFYYSVYEWHCPVTWSYHQVDPHWIFIRREL